MKNVTPKEGRLSDVVRIEYSCTERGVSLKMEYLEGRFARQLRAIGWEGNKEAFHIPSLTNLAPIIHEMEQITGRRFITTSGTNGRGVYERTDYALTHREAPSPPPAPRSFFHWAHL